MDVLLDGLRRELELVTSGDREVVATTLRTLRVGVEATVLAALVGLPLGLWLGAGGRRRGARTGRVLVNAGLRTPPVAVGHGLWLLMWPDSRWGGGLLSSLGWLYTLPAVIAAQALLALPVVAALTAAAVERLPPGLVEQAVALGAGRRDLALLMLREARVGVVAALIAALGTAIASVGAIVIVGSSLGSATLATAALSSWTAGGADARAVAYGLVLLALFLALAAGLTATQLPRARWTRTS